MKKVTILILLSGSLFAQKPLEFALKYNVAPNLLGSKAFGIAMEFPISKVMSIDLSHAGGFKGRETSSQESWKYRTILAELRFNIYTSTSSAKFRGFAGPYIRHKYVDRNRNQKTEGYLYYIPKVDFESKAISWGLVGGLNVAIKEQFVIEAKLGVGYGKRYEIKGNDFPIVFTPNPIDGVAGLSIGYNFKQ